MKTLFVIRHAKSSWNTPGMRDFDRPLNQRGLRDAPFMAAMLAKQHAKPDLIVSSPAKRALTTAQYFADAFGIPKTDIVTESSIYEAYVEDLLDVVTSLDDRFNTVLLFGHNPGLTLFINDYDENSLINLSTCGIAELTCDAEQWSDWSSANVKFSKLQIPKDFLIE